MIIVNTTFAISGPLAARWLSWIESVWTPAAEASGAGKPMVLRLVMPAPDEGVAYSVQQTFPTLVEAEAWLNQCHSPLMSQVAQLWGDSVLGFTSILEQVI